MSNVKDIGYCGKVARKYDSDRFLISLVMPPETRPALWALLAFNHEVAKTREVVTDTTLGLIRLQWWRDALKKIYEGGGALQNEILPALQDAIKTYSLPREEFDALVYAREFDLENVAPAALDGLVNYAVFTNAPLLRLALKIVGQEENDETVRRVAAGYGLAGILRATHYLAREQRSLLPADLAAAQEPKETVAAVAEKAREELAGARPCGKLLKAAKIIALLHLGQIGRLGHDVFDARMAAGPAFFHLRFLFRLYIWK